MNTQKVRIAFVMLLGLLAAGTYAATINTLQDNFTGASASLSWTALQGACLTAGNNSGTIPECKGLAYYGSQAQVGLTNNQDTVGNGALRLTNANNYEYGAIISNTTFPTDQGIQVTFTTYTYGGGYSDGHGADGIGFYLLNGGQSPNIGSWGGSLGYSCSNNPVNAPYNGMVGGYLGLGIDEYGNFLNQGDNTATGYGAQAGRIGLRGYGNVAWSSLTANYPTDYPSSGSYALTSGTSGTQATAVQDTCETGYLWNFNKKTPTETTTAIADYAVIPNAYLVLPSTTPIANETATTRANATPISYKLTIDQNDLLSLSYSYNGGNYVPVLTNQNISTSNGTMPSSFGFGFGGSAGGEDNVHEITCFQVAPANLAASSASLNVQQSGQIQTSTQVYLAFYHTDNWWGQLTSQNLTVNPSTGAASINPVANWDASCVLTGGACQATGATSMSAQASRTLLSWNGTQGISLAWGNLTTTEQGWLNGDSNGQNRLAYLSGSRTNEVNSSGVGLFRARNSVLGDIIDSSPTWVGNPYAPYPAVWTDNLYATSTMLENASGAQTYSQYASTNATRLNVVYDGSNDGFLHGFEAGSYNSSGTYVSTTNDGKEVVAYMPQAVLQTIYNPANNGNTDYSSVHYAHNYFVDATPGIGDLFYNNAWHTWLVSGLGKGGNALFALDISNPTAFSSSNVIKEWNTNNPLSCSNVTNCGYYLGNTYGTPQIRRLHNGQWAILFGNGFNSTTSTTSTPYHAGIYVMTISSSGTPSTTYFLDTGATGTSSKPNGIAYVTPADLDGDHITDYVYAGDLQGNVWRFDLTSSNPANWGVSTYGGTGAHALFTTSSGQPITTQLVVYSSVMSTGMNAVMVSFGTGQSIEPSASSAITYTTGQQALYGIIDWDMKAWDSLSPYQYQSWTGQSGAPSASSPVTLSKLQQQTITGTYTYSSGNTTGYRTVSNTPLASGKFGWYLNLPAYLGVSGVGSGNATEQVVYNPIVQDGAIILNTVVPPNNSPYTCTIQSAQSWTMALNPATGGALPASFFPLANVGAIVSGVAVQATGTPTIVNAMVNGNQTNYLVNQTVNGQGDAQQIIPQYGNNGGQLTWIEIR